jgi:hypothetical protein
MRLSLQKSGARLPRVHLGEDLEQWTLNPRLSNKRFIRLEEIAKRTDIRYHLIRHDERAIQIAHSIEEGGGDIQLLGIFTSPLAGQIDEAIKWLDRYHLQSAEARFLVLPYFHVHAFWLACDDKDSVLLVDMPVSLSGLKYRRIYSAKEFLKILSRLKIPRLPKRTKG